MSIESISEEFNINEINENENISLDVSLE